VSPAARHRDPLRVERTAEAGHLPAVVLAEPEVHRTVSTLRVAHDGCGLTGVGRRDDHHARKEPHHADVLDRVVRDSRGSVLEPSTHADDADGKVVPYGTVSEELVPRKLAKVAIE